MRRIIVFFLALFIIGSALCQSKKDDIILSQKTKKINAQRELINSIRVFNQPENLTVALKAYEDLFDMIETEESRGPYYQSYADVLAQSGNLNKAIYFYDMAYNKGFEDPKEFGYQYRRDYFSKDTALYNKKLREYMSMCVHTTRELELIYELKQLLAADQFARKYEIKHPECTDIVRFSDSLIMVKLVKLMELYPEYENILSLDEEVSIILSRHIFSAYPQFWLKYFEESTRKRVEAGICLPFVYADLYDKCIIRAYGSKSYYGQWDNNGQNTNPDIKMVNKRRAWLGLPPMNETKKDEFMIMPAYD
jgi:hypothetical protein